jgi:hypothetical protein
MARLRKTTNKYQSGLSVSQLRILLSQQTRLDAIIIIIIITIIIIII